MVKCLTRPSASVRRGDYQNCNLVASHFPGFESLTANFLYCPNQFFDVCLGNSSRGAIRLVSYVLRKVLGWLDENGNPTQQNVSVSYSELIRHAGISRGGIRKGIDEAIVSGFLSRSKSGGTHIFALRWDTGSKYNKSAESFAGFYAGEGHRSPIPTAFFDEVVPTQSLAVVKVVGTVLRHTVGYQNQFGGRRSQATLSYDYMQQYGKIGGRTTLADAVREAINAGYIRCVNKGHFDPSGRRRQASTYAVKWLADATSSDSSKTVPVHNAAFKNRTSNSSKAVPGKRFNNRTNRKTNSNNTNKQQDGVSLAAAENSKSVQLLVAAGFDQQAAQTLARTASLDEIRQQTAWIELRNPRDNRLGMLRRSIEQKWSQPETAAASENQQRLRKQRDQTAADRSAEQTADRQRRQERLQRRSDLLRRWRKLSCEQRERWFQQTLDETEADFQRNRIRRKGYDEDVSYDVLQLFSGSLVSTD